MTTPTARQIPDRLTGPAARALKSWEALLLVVAIVLVFRNSGALAVVEGVGDAGYLKRSPKESSRRGRRERGRPRDNLV